MLWKNPTRRIILAKGGWWLLGFCNLYYILIFPSAIAVWSMELLKEMVFAVPKKVALKIVSFQRSVIIYRWAICLSIVGWRSFKVPPTPNVHFFSSTRFVGKPFILSLLAVAINNHFNYLQYYCMCSFNTFWLLFRHN